ncbi:MAG: polysaccharide deacetylase, partial [Zhenhengia sp.]
MKKLYHLGILLLSFVCLLMPIYASSLDNTKIDWWLVRSKDHSTPRINEDLKFDLKTYDAYYVGDTSSKVLY